MNCKETERLIPLFLSKELKMKDMRSFLLHVEECPECMEELTIQYLVMTGTSLIEEGKSFDLRKALDALLAEAWAKVNKRRKLTVWSYILEVLTIVVVIMVLIMVMLL